MPGQIAITKRALEECKNELVYLKTVRAKEIADTIKRTRSFGSLSENGEYERAVSVAQLESIIASDI